MAIIDEYGGLPGFLNFNFPGVQLKPYNLEPIARTLQMQRQIQDEIAKGNTEARKQLIELKKKALDLPGVTSEKELVLEQVRQGEQALAQKMEEGYDAFQILSGAAPGSMDIINKFNIDPRDVSFLKRRETSYDKMQTEKSYRESDVALQDPDHPVVYGKNDLLSNKDYSYLQTQSEVGKPFKARTDVYSFVKSEDFFDWINKGFTGTGSTELSSDQLTAMSASNDVNENLAALVKASQTDNTAQLTIAKQSILKNMSPEQKADITRRFVSSVSSNGKLPKDYYGSDGQFTDKYYQDKNSYTQNVLDLEVAKRSKTAVDMRKGATGGAGGAGTDDKAPKSLQDFVNVVKHEVVIPAPVINNKQQSFTGTTLPVNERTFEHPPYFGAGEPSEEEESITGEKIKSYAPTISGAHYYLATGNAIKMPNDPSVKIVGADQYAIVSPIGQNPYNGMITQDKLSVMLPITIQFDDDLTLKQLNNPTISVPEVNSKAFMDDEYNLNFLKNPNVLSLVNEKDKALFYSIKDINSVDDVKEMNKPDLHKVVDLVCKNIYAQKDALKKDGIEPDEGSVAELKNQYGLSDITYTEKPLLTESGTGVQLQVNPDVLDYALGIGMAIDGYTGHGIDPGVIRLRVMQDVSPDAYKRLSRYGTAEELKNVKKQTYGANYKFFE